MSKCQFKEQVIEIYKNKKHTGKRRAKIENQFFLNMQKYYPNMIDQNISELFFWIINNLDDYPKCKCCSKSLHKKFRSVRDGYNSKFCSIKCSLVSTDRNEKSKQTCLERYGVEFPNQADVIRKKTENTCLKKYGVKNPQQNICIKQKTRDTFFKRYGDDYSKTRMKYKSLILPSGTIIKYQGYENIVILELLKTHSENEILIHNVPKISYVFNNCDRFHLPDIFIPDQNLLIEVKSQYTFEIKKEQNLVKQQAAKKLGFNYEIWICDSNKILAKIK